MKILRITFRLSVFSVLCFMLACSKDGGQYNEVAKEKKFEGDTYEYLKSKPGIFDSLVSVIDRLGLEKILRDSNITLFALDNQSFRLAINNLNNIRRLSEKAPVSYANVKYKHLDTLMTQYIIRGKYASDSLVNQDGIKVFGVKYGYPMHARLNKLAASGYSGGGPRVIDLFDTKRSLFNRNWIEASTTSINIKTANAFVHVMSNDHIFGFNDFVYRMTFIPPPPNLFKTVGGVGMVEPGKEAPDGPKSTEASENAFDGNPVTKFFYPNSGALWLQFKLNTATAANAYTLSSGNDNEGRDPTDWSLMGSHDGETWVTLDARAGEIFEQRFEVKVFRISNKVAYKYYRLNITRSRGNYMQLADWTVNYGETEEE